MSMMYSMQCLYMAMYWAMQCFTEVEQGKLPTASAVVGDIVEIARHLDENIPVEWREEKLELADYKQLKKQIFCPYYSRESCY